MQNNHLSNEYVSSICELSDMGFMKVSGIDSKKFLQGQLTCHMDEVTINQHRMGALCNPKGRIISLFYIFLHDDSYYLLMPRSMVPLTISALKKFAVFFKTELSDASDDFSVIGYTGTNNQKIDDTLIELSISPQRKIIIAQASFIKNQWTFLATQFQVITTKQWKMQDLLLNIPSLYPQTSEKFLPHEINLDKLNALHFDKGCYTGQEIIARMHYRGKLKNHLYQVIITTKTVPKPGMNIYHKEKQEAKPIGVIVDVGVKEDNHYYMLIVSDEANAKNLNLAELNEASPFFTDF